MTPAEFAAKWSASTRAERAAAQEHFVDLCRMLGVPTPNEADPTGAWYAFEKGIGKAAGGEGFADIWGKSHFAWEHKGYPGRGWCHLAVGGATIICGLLQRTRRPLHPAQDEVAGRSVEEVDIASS
jgi:hypothetical protein